MIELLAATCRVGGRPVFVDLDLSIPPGQVLGVVGPTLGGKTTLLRVLAGLRGLDAGALRIDGAGLAIHDREALARWQRRVGMAFQENALFDELSVFDNVALPLRRRGVAEDEVDARVTERLAQVGLGAHRDKTPGALSGGMQKRVGIARAIVHAPDCGLFDDPTAGLDPLSARDILGLIATLAAERAMTTVIVSHAVPALSKICERVVMLAEGRLVFDGSPRALATSENLRVREYCLR